MGHPPGRQINNFSWRRYQNKSVSTASRYQQISVRDYLDGERQARRKHEYVRRRRLLEAGGTVQHSRIASNVTGAFFTQLRGQGCQVFNSDRKVRVRLSHGTRFYHPDVSVVCHPNPDNDSYHDAPVVIVEVISESARRIRETRSLSVDRLALRLRLRSDRTVFGCIALIDVGTAGLTGKSIPVSTRTSRSRKLSVTLPLPQRSKTSISSPRFPKTTEQRAWLRQQFPVSDLTPAQRDTEPRY